MQSFQQNENTTTSSAAFKDLIENRDSPRTRARRKTLKTEKQLDTIAEPNMAMNNKPRNRMWMRTTAFLLFLGCVILFFVPEEKLPFKSSSELDLAQETVLKPNKNVNIEHSKSDKIKDTTPIAPVVPKKSKVSGPKKAAKIPSQNSSKLSSKHCTVPHPGRPLIQYALMLDAGSTGSRIHVYRFNYCKASPELEDEIFAHIEPGLSSYGANPEAAANSLNELMEIALKNVPKELYHCTPVAVKATAGLRLLGLEKSERILEAVREHLDTNYPFPIVEKDGVVIMDGKDEGVYAWITVNYLLDTLGSGKKLPTAAIFDLGGGSTQIVFEPETRFEVAPGEHKYELEYGGHKYILYQHSYLHYGLMEARKAIKRFMAKLWISTSSDKKNNVVPGVAASKLDISDDHIPHPCLPKNYTEEFPLSDVLHSRDEDAITIVGTGAGHAQCRFIVEQVLNKTTECPLSPCSFNGIYQPSLDVTFSVHDIYAFSYFYDRVSPLGIPTDFSLKELRDLTDAVCEGNDNQFSHLPEAMKEIKKNPHYCMDLTFIYGLLHIGYEIPLDREVKIAKKIKGIETGWCLGAAIAVLDQNLWCK
ncbi:nucleoside phosphatase family-domain-containing protein [Glomus cerebriforme]|uniref:guanosine-diphosphatase n=1 Tax=Glomus cerebriforme TaxID=658196 RepID=A0A397TMQ4_9GLOM|nr:nucleoside phosphatase family-domain-containing protein [Glomus cerebriforme]